MKLEKEDGTARVFGSRTWIGAAVLAGVAPATTACDGGQQLAGNDDDGVRLPDGASDGADGPGEAGDRSGQGRSVASPFPQCTQ